MLRICWRANRSWAAAPREALEAALGVLDRRRRPRPTRAGGRPCRAAAGTRGWRLAHVGAVGLDPAAERDVAGRERLDEQRDLVGRRRHVRVGEDDEVARRREHAGPDRRALAAVRHRRARRRRPVGAASGRAPDEVGGAVGAAVVDDEDVDRRRQLGRAGRAVARLVAAPVEVRRTARRGPGRSAPPRCRPAGRSVNVRRSHRGESTCRDIAANRLLVRAAGWPNRLSAWQVRRRLDSSTDTERRLNFDEMRHRVVPAIQRVGLLQHLDAEVAAQEPFRRRSRA